MGAEKVYLSPEIIANLCLDKYRELPKTGKPTTTQWTVLAGIVLYNKAENSSKVISLGMGTKCIGGSKLCRSGLIVNDSHAEILARRGLLRYLYYQLKETNAHDRESSVLAWNAEKRIYVLKPEYSFHFFSSQSPCGDACILDNAAALEEPTSAKRRKLSQETDAHSENNAGEVLASNVIYTGAKLFDNSSLNGDRMAQTLGALRIKPGKGDRTLSMSCSDKLSKWCFLGVQGAIMSILLENPIYFSSMAFIEGSKLEALQRSIYGRWKTKDTTFECNAFHQHEPNVRICNKSIIFECAQTEDRNQPCPNGLVWCDVPDELNACEVVVNGKRQGCTKKVLKTPEAALKISKYQMLQNFVDVLRRNRDVIERCNLTEEHLTTLSYRDAKNLAKSYQEAWTLLKAETFGLWTQKPTDMLEFSISTVNNTVGPRK